MSAQNSLAGLELELAEALEPEMQLKLLMQQLALLLIMHAYIRCRDLNFCSNRLRRCMRVHADVQGARVKFAASNTVKGTSNET